MKIKDPLIEILAIKLYEHDAQSGTWPNAKPGWEATSWMKIADEDRDIYRKMARGRDPLPDNQ